MPQGSSAVRPTNGIWGYDMIYLLTAIGLSPGGRSTLHIYTQTIHRTIKNKQYIEQHNKIHRTTQQIHRATQPFTWEPIYICIYVYVYVCVYICVCVCVCVCTILFR